MIARGQLDVGWSDLLAGAAGCLSPRRRESLERQVEALWSSADDAVACLSVRSGLDLLLTVLAYPKGTEILVSAVTIRDMIRIVEHHGLVPVPVDVDMRTLAVSMDSLRRSATPRTKAILIAHLFGSRMPLEDAAAFASERGLLLLEDCAQSFTADDYHGHSASDVSLFSFGPIKTSTALGGAMLRVRDASLLARMRALQCGYPVQGRWAFFQRVFRFAVVRLAMCRLPFTVVCATCRALGRSHDELISHSVRGFSGPDFLANIRRQPSVPLLSLLRRRLVRSQVDRARIARRVAAATAVLRAMPEVRRPGCAAVLHSHWTFPVLSTAPDDLLRHLWAHGFDATRGAWSLFPVPVPPGSDHPHPNQAHETMRQVVYLPVYPEVSPGDLDRLARVTLEFFERDGREDAQRRVAV